MNRMPTPHYISNGSQKLYLEYFGESSERLHIITSCNPISIQFTIYEMQRDKSDWDGQIRLVCEIPW